MWIRWSTSPPTTTSRAGRCTLADPSTPHGTGRPTSVGAGPLTPLAAGAQAMAGAAHGAHGDDHAHNPNLQHHFHSMDQQLEASVLGMWVFLVTEIMFFGGMFMAYILYRVQYPQAWVEGSNHLDVTLGALNTG